MSEASLHAGLALLGVRCDGKLKALHMADTTTSFERASAILPERLSRTPYRWYMRKLRRPFALGVAALFFTNLFDALTPVSLKFGLDAISSGDKFGLKQSIAVYLVLMAAAAVFRYLWRVHFGSFHHQAAEDLRRRIYDKLCELGPTYFQRTSVGATMSLMANDVNSFRTGIGPGVLTLIDATLVIAFVLPVMIWISWDWTWKCLIALPMVPFLIRWAERAIRERFREQQDRLSETSAKAAEIVLGIRAIKGCAQENAQLAEFDGKSREFELACNRSAFVDASFQPIMEFAVAAGGAALLWFGTPQVARGTITLGAFVAFFECIKRMTWPMSALGMGVSQVEQGLASFDRVREMLATETDVRDDGSNIIESFQSLEAKNLTYRHPGADEDALRDVCFVIRAGETVGITGPVGAGKSTLLQALCRLYPTQRGSVLCNGAPIEDFSLTSLRKTISYAPQEAFLFSDTVADNLALGLDQATDLGALRAAAESACLASEIDTLPRGYGEYLGERGVNLSGGQKQRLSLARSLIRAAPLLILDDALSAVDGAVEREIVERAFLREAKAAHSRSDARSGRATIVVSHRLATLRHADRIYFLEGGRVEACGTHRELLLACPAYARLNLLQQGVPADCESRA